MDHAMSIACFSGLALTCLWAWLRIEERNTAIVALASVATALLCGTVVAGSLGLFTPRPAAGQVWVEGHYRTLPDDDLTNNLGAR